MRCTGNITGKNKLAYIGMSKIMQANQIARWGGISIKMSYVDISANA